MTPPRWVGIDQGYSQMGLAIVSADGQVLASVKTREPGGDGHDRDVALARLRGLLGRVHAMRHGPVRLAGYCYAESGVREAFAQAGWTVRGEWALNDVLGVYGLTAMPGHAVVAGCGTYSQVVYIDRRQAVCWPGDDVAAELPEWLLSGEAYAGFVAALSHEEHAGAGAEWVRQVAETLGPAAVDVAPATWCRLGPLLSAMLDAPSARAFVERAATAVVQARDVFWRYAQSSRPPDVILGGGAVADDGLWWILAEAVSRHGMRPERAAGDPAVGLARFAMAHPHADAWAFVGRVRPAWLS
jgi:hypothetical protein